MFARDISRPALLRATALGTVLQSAMVVAGHYLPAIAQLFGPLGMTLSLLAGAAYVVWANAAGEPSAVGVASVGGAIAGAACAFIGIAISLALGDVTAALLAFGTASSALAGALGGALVAAYQRRRTGTGSAGPRTPTARRR
jgi:hypothetical protein